MLDAITPLSGFDETINDVRIREVCGLAFTSLAIPNGGAKAFATAVKKATGLAVPEPGYFTNAAKSADKLLWMTPDQFFLIQDESPATSSAIQSTLAGKAYLTDQSDSWVTISVTGACALEALERICPLNLHKDVFEIGMAGRTHMEHLGAVILRTGEQEWWLMSARSSAHSFLHAITQSAKNI